MSWKTNLHNLDIDDAEFQHDRNAVWLKLQHRLQRSTPTYRLSWMLAAACASGVLFFSLYLAKQKTNAPTQQRAITVIRPKMIDNTVIEEQTLTAASTIARKNIKESRKMTGIKKTAIHITIVEQPVATSETQPSIEPAITTELSASPAIVASPPLAQRTLPVVHINELGEPGQGTIRLTKSDKNRLIRFGLATANKNAATAAANNMTFSISSSKKNATN